MVKCQTYRYMSWYSRILLDLLPQSWDIKKPHCIILKRVPQCFLWPHSYPTEENESQKIEKKTMHYPRVRRKGLGPKGLGIYISLLLPLTCKAKQMSVVSFSDKHSLSMSCPVYKACLSAQITMPSSLTNFHHIITNIIRHLFGMKLLHWQHEYLSVLPKEELTDNS